VDERILRGLVPVEIATSSAAVASARCPALAAPQRSALTTAASGDTAAQHLLGARLRSPPDGRQGIIAAAERPVDLVHIEASRVELCRRLEAKPFQHLPVLLVSWIGKHLA